MLTKSFRKGFGNGFTSPFNLVIPSSIEFPEPVTVDRAWKGVIKTAAESISEGAERIKRDRKGSITPKERHRRKIANTR